MTEIDDDGVSDAQLEAALSETPRGAFALAGLAVSLLLVGWFYIYFFIFVPRGAVG
jgi:hypothetical protein